MVKFKKYMFLKKYLISVMWFDLTSQFVCLCVLSQFVETISSKQTELDTFIAEGYKTALSEERRRYCFLVDRQCAVAKNSSAYHGKASKTKQKTTPFQSLQLESFILLNFTDPKSISKAPYIPILLIFSYKLKCKNSTISQFVWFVINSTWTS